jgi:hypothetical protein
MPNLNDAQYQACGTCLGWVNTSDEHGELDVDGVTYYLHSGHCSMHPDIIGARPEDVRIVNKGVHRYDHAWS